MVATTYSAIYAFGDSLSDAGDAYLLTTSSIASTYGLSAQPGSPPYYTATYAAPGGGTLAANLFSNGPVWVQDLAGLLGLAAPGPGSVGLDTPFGYQTVAAGAAGGTDFAIGGSVTGTTAENTDAAVPLTSLAAQLGNFEHAISAPAAGALYTVWSGSNDLLNLFQDSNFATLLANGSAANDVTASVNNEVAMVRDLVTAGAQSLLVLNVPDLGKIPEITALGVAASAGASQLAASFNAQLAADLAVGFGGARVTLQDTFGLIDGAVANPAAYGLTNVTGSVYSGGFSGGSTPTITGAAQNGYLFFDGLHPTATGHTAIANQAFAALAAACFAGGTLVAVPGGTVPVEALRPGDAVVVRGGLAAVGWVGRRHVTLTGHPDCRLVRPVRIAAGTFGGGLPRRDLLLSPEHAVFADGALVPARALVGCPGIAVDTTLDRVTYYHVALAEHDVLLAEGLPCESWLDTGNRAMFEDAPRGGAAPRTACAAFVESGPLLDALRLRLGGAATQEVVLERPGVHDVAIAHGTGAIRLASRAGHAPGDARRLGVAISALALDGEPLGLDDGRLASGFHAPEGVWRWTDGAGLLTVGHARALRVDVAALVA